MPKFSIIACNFLTSTISISVILLYINNITQICEPLFLSTNNTDMKQVWNMQCVYNSHEDKKQGGLLCWCVWVALGWPVANRSSLKPLLSGWIIMLKMDSQGPIISKWIMSSNSHFSLATDWIWAWHYGSLLQIWNLHKDNCALYCFFCSTFYIYAFSRRFYPKRLTVHSGYTYFCQYVFPGNQTHNLCAANAML